MGTDSQGNKKILRAGPEHYGFVAAFTDDLKVVYADYTKENQDLFKGDFRPKNAVKVYTMPVQMLKYKPRWKRWIGKQINAGNYDYKLPTPLCPESICHVQNSNTDANLMAKAVEVDLKPVLDEIKLWAPGLDGHLDIWIILFVVV